MHSKIFLWFKTRLLSTRNCYMITLYTHYITCLIYLYKDWMNYISKLLSSIPHLHVCLSSFSLLKITCLISCTHWMLASACSNTRTKTYYFTCNLKWTCAIVGNNTHCLRQSCKNNLKIYLLAQGPVLGWGQSQTRILIGWWEDKEHPMGKDLRALVDEKFDMSQYCAPAAQKANWGSSKEGWPAERDRPLLYSDFVRSPSGVLGSALWYPVQERSCRSGCRGGPQRWWEGWSTSPP